MIWFTSDWHLGHSNIAGPSISKWPTGYRNFETTEQMDSVIINTINKYVLPTDTLFNLGDLCFSEKKRIPYLERIWCKDIRFCKGNHDKNVHDISHLGQLITWDHIQTYTHQGTHIFMSHYAHRVWPHSHKGSIHLYGHSHDTIEDHGKSMDVGIDTAYRLFGEYRPFSLDQILKMMERRAITIVDHHNNGRE